MESSLEFAEKLLNNKLEDLRKKDIIESITHCDENREITIITKGIDTDEPYYFSEKYNKNMSLVDQTEMFVSSCCVMWKLFFIKFNNDYRLTLLRRNWIGNTHAHRTTNHFPNRIHTQAPVYGATQQPSQLF